MVTPLARNLSLPVTTRFRKNQALASFLLGSVFGGAWCGKVTHGRINLSSVARRNGLQFAEPLTSSISQPVMWPGHTQPRLFWCAGNTRCLLPWLECLAVPLKSVQLGMRTTSIRSGRLTSSS
mmetsp:Transcript_27037/g.105163  ORF Transcript_27037/g.105163 Transcript_27037/m.105163 type:complete len:123 (-) Transcript_27037:2268-2636(-)